MSDDIRDERLSRLYRETDDAAPPEALDRAILAAARAEVAPARKRAGWRAWMVPMGVAATVMLTATLTLMVQREQEPPLPEAPPAQSAPAAAPQEKTDAAGLAAKPAAPPSRTKQEVAPRETEHPAVAAPAPAPEAVVPVLPPIASEPKVPPAAPAPAMRQQAVPAADAVEMRAKSAPLRKEAVGAALARTPEQWLEDIRQLKKQGKEQEAAGAMAEFGKAYPDYKLPEDLR